MQIQQFSIILLGIIILVILYALVGSFFQHKHIHIIHETGVGIIIGFIFGLIMWLSSNLSKYQFNQQIFFYALLPPIIFSGGYNLKKRKFFQNFTYILLFGLLGTLASFGIILGLTFLINNLKLIRGWADFSQQIILSTGLIVKFSATICATDSVAALTIIKPSKYPKLFSIVFGQGMVNDAVAIILFRVVGNMFGSDATEQSPGMMIFTITWKFVVNLLASLLIGIAIGLICSKVFQLGRFLITNPVMQVCVLYLFGIMSYIVAQIAEMSGVITVLVCGVCLAHFNFYNLSVTGQLSTGVAFQSISFIAQAFIFVYLGISTMYYVTQQDFSYTFVLLQLVICFIARFGAIYGLSLLIKICMKKWNVSMYQLLIVSFAGTIRGSVAFALILTIQNQHDDKDISIVKSSVLLMVFITTIFLGAAMPKFITVVLSKDTENQAQSNRISLLQQQKSKQKSDKPRPFFKMFDEEYLKPFFIYRYRERKMEIKQFKKLLKLNSPEYKGGQFIALMKANARQSLVGELDTGKDKKSLFTEEQQVV